MKKWLALMFVCAFIGSVASAQWLVYDYKASVKRLDSKITEVKYSPDSYDQTATAEILFDSYTTAIDTLKGYLVTSICIGCEEETGSDGSLPFAKSYMYVKRGADKTKAIWKFTPDVWAALFNVGVTVRPLGDELEGRPTSLKKLTQAWMGIEFEFEDFGLEAPFGKYGDLPYGFLGHGSSSGYVASTGFGKAKLLSETSITFCNPPTSISCFVISSITDGRAIGWTYQKGVCTEIPIWDVCNLEIAPDGDSVIHATWSVKLNEKLSASVNAQSTFAGAENLLITKLGGGELIGESESSD